MPKTYSEGHKAREITLAEAAIVKLREAADKALDTRERTLMRLHWLRAMPVPKTSGLPSE